MAALDAPGEIPMHGSIRSKQRCPECGAANKWRHHRGRSSDALVCSCGKAIATRLYVVIGYKRKVLWIGYDRAGNRLQSYEQAERAQAQISEDIDAGRFIPQMWLGVDRNRLLWRNYRQDYLKREAGRLTRKATLDKKRSLLAHTAWMDEMNIRDIRAGHLADYEALPCLRMALADKTRADLMGEIRALLRNAYAREEIERIPEVPTVKVPKKAVAWMNQEEQTAILEQIPTQHRPIFFFLMEYGTRPSEACALCWDNIDFKHGIFTLTRTFSRRKLCQGTKQRADNPLPIVGWFADHLATLPRSFGSLPVFQNPEADTSRNELRFYLPDFLNKLWHAAIKAAGAKPIRLYNGTRHSVGTQRSLEGWSREDISRLLGHASLAHTDKYIDCSQVETLRNKMSVSKPFLSVKGSTNVSGSQTDD
jgi:integrase